MSRSCCLDAAGEANAFGPNAAHALEELGEVYRAPGFDLGARQELSAFQGAPAIEILESASHAPALPIDDDFRQDGRDRCQLEYVHNRLARRELECFGGRYVAHRVDLHDV
jgi:hypothetical protein